MDISHAGEIGRSQRAVRGETPNTNHTRGHLRSSSGVGGGGKVMSRDNPKTVEDLHERNRLLRQQIQVCTGVYAILLI